MCGVHAVMRMPSATAMRAISSDVASSGAPSSMPGSMWQWRSIMADGVRRRWPVGSRPLRDPRSPPARVFDAPWNITPASVANHIALAGMCSAKSNRLCRIIGTMPRPARDLQQREAAAAVSPQQRAHPRRVRDEQQHDDDRRREPELHECLQVVVVRIVDVAADVRDLEAREDVGVRRQPAAERQELDGRAQRRRVDGPAKIGARLQLAGLEAPQHRPDADRERDADRDHDEADDDVIATSRRDAMRACRGRAHEHDRRAREPDERRWRCRRASA